LLHINNFAHPAAAVKYFVFSKKKAEIFVMVTRYVGSAYLPFYVEVMVCVYICGLEVKCVDVCCSKYFIV
jgi:hypothetical protein